MNTLSPLSHLLKKPTKIEEGLDWQDISRQSQASITADEFVSASSNYPLFFIKNSHSGQFSSTTILGLLQDNVFFDGTANTDVPYIPKSLTMLPFVFGADPDDDDKLTICINTQSALLNNKNENAKQLINDKGEDSQYIKTVREKFSAMYQENVATEHFINALVKLNLLIKLELHLQFSDGKKQVIKGLYNINEQKLNQLNDQQKLTFIAQGYYPPIMAMLASLIQINRIIQRYNQYSNSSNINAVNIKAAT